MNSEKNSRAALRCLLGMYMLLLSLILLLVIVPQTKNTEVNATRLVTETLGEVVHNLIIQDVYRDTPIVETHGNFLLWNSSTLVIRLDLDGDNRFKTLTYENSFSQATVRSRWLINHFFESLGELLQPGNVGDLCKNRSQLTLSMCPTNTKWAGIIGNLCFETSDFSRESFSGLQLLQLGRLHCPELVDFFESVSSFKRYSKSLDRLA